MFAYKLRSNNIETKTNILFVFKLDVCLFRLIKYTQFAFIISYSMDIYRKFVIWNSWFFRYRIALNSHKFSSYLRLRNAQRKAKSKRSSVIWETTFDCDWEIGHKLEATQSKIIGRGRFYFPVPFSLTNLVLDKNIVSYYSK